jgi:hypothetical protein
MSSGNNAKLVEAGKRFRGRPTTETHTCHAPGVPPTGPLDGPSQGGEWCGLRWSKWLEVAKAAENIGRGCGVYRIRGDEDASLLYIGQGVIGARLVAHVRKRSDLTNPQGGIFGSVRRLECSYVVNDAWEDHQRLEVENDLVAAHVISAGSVPAAQFVG